MILNVEQMKKTAQKLVSDLEFNEGLRITYEKFARRYKVDSVPLSFVTMDYASSRASVFEPIITKEEWSDPEKRARCMHEIGQEIFEQGIQLVAVYQAAEAWMENISGKELKNLDINSYRFSGHEQTTTANLIVHGSTIDGRKNIARGFAKDGKFVDPEYILLDADSKTGVDSFMIDEIMLAYVKCAQERMKKKKHEHNKNM